MISCIIYSTGGALFTVLVDILLTIGIHPASPHLLGQVSSGGIASISSLGRAFFLARSADGQSFPLNCTRALSRLNASKYVPKENKTISTANCQSVAPSMNVACWIENRPYPPEACVS